MNFFIDFRTLLDPRYQLSLHGVAACALEGSHRIFVDGDREPAFLAWLADQSQALRDQWLQVIDQSYRLEALEPARRAVRVSDVVNSNWAKAIPEISPTDASLLSKRPFCLVVENSTSDRNFLMKMADVEQKKRLEELLQSGAMIFEHGGGITEMPKRIARAVDAGQIHTLTMWVLFDSDALEPAKPSRQSEHLKQQCQNAAVSHHQLSRRNIENYIPRKALQGWIYANRMRSNQSSKAYTALCGMNFDQRAHYNMKEGFNADSKRNPPPNPALFSNLSMTDRQALADGFAKDLATVYETGFVQEADLRTDGCWAEMNPVVVELIALLR